jgi:hypothetical protein
MLQVDVAERSCVSTRSLRRYESGGADLGPLRVFSDLIDEAAARGVLEEFFEWLSEQAKSGKR